MVVVEAVGKALRYLDISHILDFRNSVWRVAKAFKMECLQL